MTELNQKNREIYLDVCKTVWNMSDETMKYIEHRTSDDWEPVPELKALIGINGSTYEDQRIRFDIDMSDPLVQSIFEKEDKAYQLFKSEFAGCLSCLAEYHSCKITYQDFINNKVVFNKNQTKIKKVLETIYKEHNEAFDRDFGIYHPDDKTISEYIVRAFERIGASKKSAKKLQFVISFNPMDWLLASTAESFSSCFNINNPSGGYQYCLGLPFLCGDKNRVMLYITNGTQKECMGIKVDSVQTRTWSILEANSKLAIVKWYPNDTIGISPVNSITKTDLFMSKEHFSKGKYPIDMLSTKKGVCLGVYSDMGKWVYRNGKLLHEGNNKDGQQWFTDNGIALHEEQNRGRSSYRLDSSIGSFFGISASGYKIPQWKKYGFNVDMMFHEATCVCCKKQSTGFFTSLKGDYQFYCKNCYVDNVFTCALCGETHMKSESARTMISADTGEEVTICEDCIRDLYKYTCNCCGRFSRDYIKRSTDGDNKYFCRECLETGAAGYMECNRCGNLTKNIKIKYNTFNKSTTKYCTSCDNPDSFSCSTFGRSYRIVQRNSVPRGQIE